MRMTVKVGINGFGRIGRNVFRHALGKEGIEIVAVNDLTDADMLAHLLKYDSVHGTLDEEVSVEGSTLKVGDREIEVLSESDPANLVGRDLLVAVVIEAIGRATVRENPPTLIDAVPNAVIMSAPAADVHVVRVSGVNEDVYNAEERELV